MHAAGRRAWFQQAPATERLRSDRASTVGPGRLCLGNAHDGGTPAGGMRCGVSSPARPPTRCRCPTRLPRHPRASASPGAGTNAAHNLPLGANPRTDDAARRQFNAGARALWVAARPSSPPPRALQCRHESQDRPRERDHPLAAPAGRCTALARQRSWHAARSAECRPWMQSTDVSREIVIANPQLRPRVGNPDELRSNRMERTLDAAQVSCLPRRNPGSPRRSTAR